MWFGSKRSTSTNERVMHILNDEKCMKILRNCRKAIPEKTGKVMILEPILGTESDGMFESIAVAFDLLLNVTTYGGKFRTELQWKKLLKEGGFSRYKIVKIPGLFSLIEAYP
ncbi:hypothetical protein U1Q18_024604 [Sarracenia purpurea var. burkii]